MNDDLHDIDHLFRDGLDGHLEDVPPLVWEGVSNDLDKKQAAYYKTKYRRLKRAALALLLLCFIGGAYVVFDVQNHKQKQEEVNKPAETNASLKETIKNNSGVTNPSQNKTPRTEKTGATETTDEATSSAPASAPLANETRKNAAPQSVEKNAADQNMFATVNLTSTKKEKGKRLFAGRSKADQPFLGNDTFNAQQEKLRNNAVRFNQPPLAPQSQSPLWQVTALPGKEIISTIEPQPLDVLRKPLFSLSNLAAANKSKKAAAHGFSLSAFVAPNFSFDRLEDDQRLAGPGRNRRDARHEENENVSFSAGLLLNYELTKAWSVQSGISFTSSSVSVAPKTVYAKTDGNGRTRYELHCSSGYAYLSPKSGVQPQAGDSAQASGTVSRLTYVSIPAAVNYRFNLGRFSLSPSVGASLNFLTSGKTTTSLSHGATNESATTDITGLKPTYVDGRLGFGIEYNVNNKLSIGMQPAARLALTPINRETPVKSYQNFLSVQTGVRIKL